jgi:glyoxylase-like metal-dependent hydrolase (beta-lactamase superfamily II)
MTADAALPAGVVVLERGWLSSNTIVIRGSDSAAVVDSGYWTHAAQTLELVERTARGCPLSLLVNTHLHSDHCGGNAALQGRYRELRTLIPPGQAPVVAVWDEVALTYQPTGQHCPRFRFDDTLRVGSSARLGDLSWEVHAAPGHDPHSVVLFEPQSRTLLSADALWQNGFGIVFQELEGEGAFQELAGTLDVIEALRPRIVVPGHGGVFSEVDAALARARSRLDAYVADPSRHAAHAAKVLLKFKLLELQRVPLAVLVEWAECTPYFRMVRERFFPAVPAGEWVASLLQDLVRSGAASADAGVVANA